MKKSVNNISEKIGLPPGSFVTVGVNENLPAKFSLYKIGPASITSEEGTELLSSLPLCSKEETLWIDIQGFSNDKMLHQVFEQLQLPPLLQEDIINTKHRPKIETFAETLLIITKRITPGHRKRLYGEQVVLLLGPNYVLTIQPPVTDSFQGARARILANQTAGFDKGYIFYMLLDNLTDSYFAVLEHLHQRIDKLENLLLNAKEDSAPQAALTSLKHDISVTRRIILPMRKFITDLRFNRAKYFAPELYPNLTDLSDHVEQLTESCDIYHESILLLLQLNSENISIRTNEIMKTLTLISTIFLPLTFISSIYGMNFTYMPELNSTWGYPLCLAFMAAIALVLYLNFRNRKWL
ncbi:MAG TPA: magnesium/cobalt transporter CorA [Candidatus Avacidaminococcus intestinavium]|uniref:Magnesium transport protein CorA n=1 Tax=Candidatus Avacidaminococcus intestinavium TaxID=2840684 RepID=A0A9D1MQG0_9FIRM|nr:magnesium/cobalt transporter CorA [Candidatus Avacidaminococcus intestinavium]